VNRQRRSAFTLFQLLVVLAIIAILIGLLLPAVAKTREAAARAQNSNSLKIIGIAMHNHNDAYQFLPAGLDNKGFSATARLLPFIEQDNVYKMIDFDKSIDEKANADARKVQIKMMLSSRDPLKSVKEEWGATNFVYNDQLFNLNSKSRIPASFPDGTSNTIITGETLKGDGGTKGTDVRRQYVLLKKDALKGIKPDAGVEDFKDNKNIAGDRCASWMDGHFLQGMFNGELKPNDTRPDVSCGGLGGVSALRSPDDSILVGLGDGSVRSVNAKKITHETWKNAICPNDGNVLGADW
jgi:type II secretory pathway pseudopilin PulG